MRRIDVPGDARQPSGMELGTKVVGNRRRAADPVSRHRRALALMRQSRKNLPVSAAARLCLQGAHLGGIRGLEKGAAEPAALVAAWKCVTSSCTSARC